MTMQHEPLPDPHRKFGQHQTPGDGGTWVSPRLIGALVLAAIIAIFIIKNGHATRISFLFFSWDTTVRWSIFIAIVLGMALDRLLGWGLRRRKSADDKDEQ
jgi:uncharacterized integral membrane protein